MSEPDLPPSEARKGDCNATDGFSVCTESPGHGPDHWDRRTQHEWSDRDALPFTAPQHDLHEAGYREHDPATCRDGDHYGQCSGVTQ